MRPIPWTPRPYMIDAVQHLCAHPKAGLFLDPGMSKTACTLAAIDILKGERAVHSTLVVAPLSVVIVAGDL